MPFYTTNMLIITFANKIYYCFFKNHYEFLWIPKHEYKLNRIRKNYNKLLRIMSTRCMKPAQYFCSGEFRVRRKIKKIVFSSIKGT